MAPQTQQISESYKPGNKFLQVKRNVFVSLSRIENSTKNSLFLNKRDGSDAAIPTAARAPIHQKPDYQFKVDGQ